MAEEILLTQEGYDKLEAERDELVSVRRKEVSERLKEAISYGDLSENAEYDAAKNEQAELEERIHKLENMLRNARIISEDEVSGDYVNVGVKVKVKEMNSGEDQEFIIVAPQKRIRSLHRRRSPTNLWSDRVFWARRSGEVVEILVPDGMLHYKIEEISR